MPKKTEMMPGFEMEAAPRDENPWGDPAVIDDGNQRVGFAVFNHPEFGKLVVGRRPEGYPAWVFREAGGGGAGTVPYTFDHLGQLWVGAIKENRPNLGSEPVLDLIGGFIDPGEDHEQAAQRELAEETGLFLDKTFRIQDMPIICNRLFWVADVSKGEGVKVWAAYVPFDQLESAGSGQMQFRQGLKPKVINPKQVASVRFIRELDIHRMSPCALLRSAVGGLVAQLTRTRQQG